MSIAHSGYDPPATRCATPGDISDFYDDFAGRRDLEEPNVSLYSPTRFPNTYAYDYLREIWPTQISRAEAAGLVRRWTERHGVSKEGFNTILAMRYMAKYNITIPTGEV